MNMAIPLVEGLAAVLGAWLFLWLLLTGLGHGLLRAVRAGAAPGPATFAASWLGYGGVVIFLQVWHLFCAVDWRALIALSALSLGGWLTILGRRREPDRSRRRWGTAIVVAIALLWLADRAIGPFNSYDGANYHLQVIRWNHQYAAVPGLANLNANYGLAGSALLVPALFDDGVFHERSQHFVNSFLIALLFSQVATGVAGPRSGNRPAAADAAALALLFPLILHLDDDAVATHSTDITITAVLYAAVLLACAGLDRLVGTDLPAANLRTADSPDADLPDADLRTAGSPATDLPTASALPARVLAASIDRPRISPDLLAAFSLLAIAPCLKATCGGFAAAVWLGLALIVARGDRPAATRWLLPAAGIAGCGFLPWAIGNVIQTGYPFYPLPLGAWPADWRLPRFHLDGQLWWTQGYAHTPEAWDLMVSRHGFSWLPYWLRFELRTAVFEVLIPATLILLLVGVWSLTRKRLAADRATVGYLLYPAGLAIAFWFLVAPSVRYGRFLFWSAAAILAAAVLPEPLSALRRRPRLAALLLAAWVASPLLLQTYFEVKHRRGRGALDAVRARFLVAPGLDHGLHPLLRVAMQNVTVCDGLTVLRPAAPDALRATARWREALPWNAPLPATANLLPQLCPRRPGELQAGFRIPDAGVSWARVNAAAVRRLRDQTGWSVGQIAVHFVVRPELIQESLGLGPR